MKGKILEIIEKHWTNHLYPMQNILDCASEIESLIKGNYVEKKFLEWYFDENNTIIIETIFSEDLNIYDVYQYWLNNIKGK